MDRKMKIFAGLIVVLFLLIMTTFYLETEAIKKMVIQPIQLQQIQDGIYEGEASTYLIKAKVEVEVKNHRIVSIDLIEYQHNRGEKAVMIIDDILHSNSLNVDAISTATYSSKVIKAAVSNALNQK